MKKISLLLTASCFLVSQAQVPDSWSSAGIGGGGALFNPTINPANPDEIYVACDMSEYFHSNDFGTTYETVPFHAIQSSANGVIRFTENSQILWGIQAAGDLAIPSRSTDGGITWNALPGNPDEFEWTYYLFSNFDNPDQMIMSYYSQLYITNNGGQTFSLVHTANNGGSGIIIAGAFFDGSNVYIGTNDGLFVSTDGGQSFSLDNATGIPSNRGIYSFAAAKSGGITRFFVLTASKSSLYAGFPPYDYWQLVKGIYAMDYGSGIWVQKQNGINTNVDFLMSAGMAENDINTCYLAGSNTTGYPNVVKTTDGGNSWSPVFTAVNNGNVSTGWSGNNGDRDWGYREVFFSIAVARYDAQRAIVTDFGFVHKTTNGGTSWYQAYVNPEDENPPGTLTPKGQDYRGVGIENTTCWQVCWIDSLNLWGAFSDIRGIRSQNGGQSWNMNYTGNDQNSTYRIVKNPSSGYLYAALSTVHDMYQSTRLQDVLLDAANSGKIIYSTDNGQTWLLLHDFGRPVFWLALDPNNANTMYASVINFGSNLGGIWKTNNLQNNGASTWTMLPEPPRTEGHPATVVVLNDGNVLCTYSGRRDAVGSFTPSSGVFLWDGISWADKSVNPNMHYWCRDIVVDPHDPLQQTWYVGVFKGWGSAAVNNAGGGLWKTTDRGNTWNRINPIDRVTSCTFSPVNPDFIYMTTETEGLWYCENVNDAIPVFAAVSSYPFRQPERVYFNPYQTGEVWVSSFGNGMRVGNTACSMPQVTITAGGPTTFCKGEEVLLTATATEADLYQWQLNGNDLTGAATATCMASESGTYTVEVSNSCGMTVSNSISITVNNKPKATITPSGTVDLCSGDTLLLTANTGNNFSYLWKRNGATIPGATIHTFAATQDGKYKVTVTKTTTGCTKTSAVTTVNVTCRDEPETTPDGVISPNPSSTAFHISSGTPVTILVSDLLGREVLCLEKQQGVITFGNNLTPGVYLVTVREASFVTTYRVIRE